MYPPAFLGPVCLQAEPRAAGQNRMNTGAAVTLPGGNISDAAAEHWHKLLQAKLSSSPKFTEKFYEELRAAKLTFGSRVHCPFLRPFFLSFVDVQRVRGVA